MRKNYNTTICVFFAELGIIYFCANELAVVPLNKGGEEIIFEKLNSQFVI